MKTRVFAEFIFDRALERCSGKARVCLAVSLLSAATGLRAADCADCECVELERVVVTARPSERPLCVMTDPRAAAQPIPAQDGAEALRGIAGISVIRKGGTDGDPVLRGMAGSRLGILLDGENILGGCGNRMDPPTAYVFPSAYDRITVLKGPQSVLYGPGNSAGVVLFEHTPRRFAVPEIKASGSFTLGSFGRNDEFVEVRAGQPLGYVEAAGTRTSSDDYEDGSGRAIASAYERWSARVAAGWTPDESTLVEVSSIVSDGEAAYADRSMDGSKFARRNVALRVRRTAVSQAVDSVEATMFVNAVDHVMDNFSLRTFVPSMMMPGRSASNPDRLTLGGRFLLKLLPDLEHWRVTAGTDFQENRHRVRSTSDEQVDPYEVNPRVKDASFQATGVFGEATYLIDAEKRIVSGARMDFWRVQDFRTRVSTSMMSTVVNPTAQQTRHRELPSMFMRYEQDFLSGATWFAGVGHAQRFPDYWELFSKESASSVSAFDTRPERMTQADVGVNVIRGKVRASLSLFANHIDDFILIETGVVKPAGMMGTRQATISRNIDSNSIGGEASLAWTFVPRWTFDFSLSAVRAENASDHIPLAQQPPVESRVGLSYATSRWSFGSLVRMVARQDRYALNQGNIVAQDLGPSAGFATFSLNGAWKPSAHFQVSVGIDNVLDRTYAEHLSRGGAMIAGFPPPTLRINEPGRTIWTKLDFRW
ncbi:MAG TPA: TonB-dependent copper receptor [Opitutaceae bacterium]|nr:TonB-dependent copper receptor [Opitutaceae bacterium]